MIISTVHVVFYIRQVIQGPVRLALVDRQLKSFGITMIYTPNMEIGNVPRVPAGISRDNYEQVSITNS